jgi:AraC-like DNA-binding protein
MQGDLMADTRRGKDAKLFGTGRAIFWRGGSIWIGHTAEGAGFHTHHAIQMTLPLSGGTVRLRSDGEDWTSYPAAVISAHHSHAFEAPGELVALIFTEPESRDGQLLKKRYRAGVASLDYVSFANEAAALAAAYADGASDDVLAACARAVTAKLASSEALPSKPLDARIERAIAVLRERLSDTVTMADIADAVHLSPDRFRHLFLQETGIRFRPYVLWLRLEVAVATYAAGKSLTEAAYAGGFADSAHLSRTFKRMFGVTANDIQLV